MGWFSYAACGNLDDCCDIEFGRPERWSADRVAAVELKRKGRKLTCFLKNHDGTHDVCFYLVEEKGGEFCYKPLNSMDGLLQKFPGARAFMKNCAKEVGGKLSKHYAETLKQADAYETLDKRLLQILDDFVCALKPNQWLRINEATGGHGVTYMWNINKNWFAARDDEDGNVYKYKKTQLKHLALKEWVKVNMIPVLLERYALGYIKEIIKRGISSARPVSGAEELFGDLFTQHFGVFPQDSLGKFYDIANAVKFVIREM